LDGCGVLGQPDRVVKGGKQDTGADLDPVGRRGHGGRGHKERRHVPVIDEVMLRCPCRCVSAAFQVHGELDQFAVHVLPRTRIIGSTLIREKSKTEHGTSIDPRSKIQDRLRVAAVSGAVFKFRLGSWIFDLESD
jgi:hypothetical protein